MTLARPKQHATAAMHYKYIIAGLNKARNLAACHCGSWHNHCSAHGLSCHQAAGGPDFKSDLVRTSNPDPAACRYMYVN